MHAHEATQRQLGLAFALALAILAVEVVGGRVAHSLALLSDAGHVLTDVAALGLAWFATAQAARPARGGRTFGYHRVGILTALVNGLALVAIALFILFEAIHRLAHPEKVQPLVMVLAAAVAVGVNLFIASRLHGVHAEDLNLRAAMLHVVGDIGASLGVIVGALAIAITGAAWVDPILSVLIAGLIAFGAARLLREVLNVLLESAPRGLSIPTLADDMRRTPGIAGVHDLHVWTISSGVRALSCHAIIKDLPPSQSARILDTLTDMLRRDYGIAHTTIQFESEEHAGHDAACDCTPPCACENKSLYCDLQPLEVAPHAHTHTHGARNAPAR